MPSRVGAIMGDWIRQTRSRLEDFRSTLLVEPGETRWEATADASTEELPPSDAFERVRQDLLTSAAEFHQERKMAMVEGRPVVVLCL